MFNVPIGGKIPDLSHMFTIEEEAQWTKGHAVSAVHYTGECGKQLTLICCCVVHLTSINTVASQHDYVCTQESAAVRRKS